MTFLFGWPYDIIMWAGHVVWLSALKSIDGCSTPINCYLNNQGVLNTR